jgi:hypothetical protein
MPPGVVFDGKRGVFQYTVRPNDTMVSIAASFGESPWRAPSLVHANPRAPQHKQGLRSILDLSPGQAIVIPEDWISKDPRPTIEGTRKQLRSRLLYKPAALHGRACVEPLEFLPATLGAPEDEESGGWSITLPFDTSWTSDVAEAIVSSAPGQLVISSYENGLSAEEFVDFLKGDQSEGTFTACEVTKIMAKVFVLCPFLAVAFTSMELPGPAVFCSSTCPLLAAAVSLASFPVCEQAISDKLVKEIFPQGEPPIPNDPPECVADPLSKACYDARGGEAYCLVHGADPACLAEQDRRAGITPSVTPDSTTSTPAPGSGSGSGSTLPVPDSGGSGQGSGNTEEPPPVSEHDNVPGPGTSGSAASNQGKAKTMVQATPAPSFYDRHKTGVWVGGALTAIGILAATGYAMSRKSAG